MNQTHEEMIWVIQAHQEGHEVEYKDRMTHSKEWQVDECPSWNFFRCLFRPALTPKHQAIVDAYLANPDSIEWLNGGKWEDIVNKHIPEINALKDGEYRIKREFQNDPEGVEVMLYKSVSGDHEMARRGSVQQKALDGFFGWVLVKREVV